MIWLKFSSQPDAGLRSACQWFGIRVKWGDRHADGFQMRKLADDDRGDLRPGQPRFAVSGVELSFHRLKITPLLGGELLRLRLGGLERCVNLGKPRNRLSRQTVVAADSDEVAPVLDFPMGWFAAREPGGVDDTRHKGRIVAEAEKQSRADFSPPSFVK
jgi:hypothetical protein